MRYAYILTIAMLFTIAAKSQEHKASGKSDAPFALGGIVGLSISQGFTYLELSPVLYYRIWDKPVTRIGGGFVLQYLNYSGLQFQRLNIGPLALVQSEIVTAGDFSVLAHTEYQYLFTQEWYEEEAFNRRLEIPALRVGGGVQYNNGGLIIQLLVLFDLIDHDESPYQRNPDYRLSFAFPF